MNQKGNKAGWGIVARNWKGELLAAWAYPCTRCSEANLEEALAVREAMIRAKEKGWQKVELESDCKGIIDKINGEMEDVLLHTVLQDIKSLQKEFNDCCFSFTRREDNTIRN